MFANNDLDAEHYDEEIAAAERDVIDFVPKESLRRMVSAFSYKPPTESSTGEEEQHPLTTQQRILLSTSYFDGSVDPDKPYFVRAVYDSQRPVRLKNLTGRRRKFTGEATINKDFRIFGRRPLYFFVCVGYYLALWSCLVGTAAIFLTIQIHTGIADYITPRILTRDSALSLVSSRQYSHPHYYGNPGLGFRPLNNDDTNLIWFVPGASHPETWAPLVGSLDAFLEHYHEHRMYSCFDCKNRPFPPVPIEKDPFLWDKGSLSKIFCCFYVKDLGRECTKQKAYGYVEGKPCVLLKLNRIVNWMPLLYENASSAPEEIRDRFHPKFIGVKCFGIHPPDREHIGEIAYYPPEGFPFYFYPYRNQKRFRSPLVFMQFLNATPGVVIFVECRAYARNIEIDGPSMTGSVRFEIMIDVSVGAPRSSAADATYFHCRKKWAIIGAVQLLITTAFINKYQYI